MRVFQSPVTPEFYQTKYEIMTAVFNAEKSDWTTAEADIPSIQEYWTHLKVQAQSTDQKTISQTEFAIHDLEQAIKSHQIDTVLIKAEIAMNNLEKLKTSLSSQSLGMSGQK